MLTFDDMLAARILCRDKSDQADLVLDTLDTLRTQRGHTSLLVDLVASGAISWDETSGVQERVNAYKKRRALRLYALILTHTGFSRADVERIATQRVDGPLALGEALVAAGLLSAAHERDLRFRARIAFDRDAARQVHDYLEALERRPRSSAASGVVRLPSMDATSGSEAAAQEASPARNPALEVTVEDETVLDPEELSRVSSAELAQLPAFEIPEWIDTSGDLVGRTLAGYGILGEIGRGSGGHVYLASEPSNPERPVALKVLRPQASPEAEGRFRRAIQASGMCQHEGLLEVYGSGETERGVPYLAMEFFEGENLARVLEAEGRFSIRRSLVLATQLFSALGAAHAAGVVHRDVKPSNILLSVDGKTAKLMDFGIAKIQGQGDLDPTLFQTSTGQGLIGTPMYASPEQAYVRSEITPSADVYSMALVLYEMLSGRIPFPQQENVWSYVSCHMNEPPLPLVDAAPQTRGLPKRFHQLMESMLAKAPEDRPQFTDAVIGELERAIDDLDASQTTGRWLFGLIGKRPKQP